MFVITGGGSGLGRALAIALALREQKVMIIGRHRDSLEETAQQSSYIEYDCADVSNPTHRINIAKKLATQSSIRGLIHNAGIIDPIASMSTVQPAEWQACFATNLEAPFFLTQLLFPYLQQGRVLHIGSGAAHFPVEGWSAYCVSKAALAMLTRCWQLEEPSMAIASVMPGIIDTPMQAKIRHATHMDEAKQDFFCRLKETGQLLSADTVATFLVWLLLDISPKEFASKEWDIYDSSHHAHWLRSPHNVPALDDVKQD
ncbi:MAG: sepiapterin reductase [Legionella sp.]|nr:MAG: sepiapterin reductase [Legionella sp.]